MPRFNPSQLLGAQRVVNKIDRAFRWRADEEIGRHLDGLYGRVDQLNDRIDELERRLAETVERPSD
jgi:hypothetical protein